MQRLWALKEGLYTLLQKLIELRWHLMFTNLHPFSVKCYILIFYPDYPANVTAIMEIHSNDTK